MMVTKWEGWICALQVRLELVVRVEHPARARLGSLLRCIVVSGSQRVLAVHARREMAGSSLGLVSWLLGV